MIALRVTCDECGRRLDVGNGALSAFPTCQGDVDLRGTIVLPEGWSTRGDGIVSPLRVLCSCSPTREGD